MWFFHFTRWRVENESPICNCMDYQRPFTLAFVICRHVRRQELWRFHDRIEKYLWWPTLYPVVVIRIFPYSSRKKCNEKQGNDVHFFLTPFEIKRVREGKISGAYRGCPLSLHPSSYNCLLTQTERQSSGSLVSMNKPVYIVTVMLTHRPLLFPLYVNDHRM